MPRPDRLRPHHILPLALALAAGCAAPPAATKPTPEPTPVAADAPADDLLTRLKPEHFKALPKDPSNSRIEGDPSIARRGNRPPPDEPTIAEAPQPPSTSAFSAKISATQPAESPAQKRARLINELADALAAAPTPEDRFEAASALTLLQALEPGLASDRLAELRAALAPDQQRTLAALSRLFAAAPLASRGSPADLARLLKEQAAALADPDGLAITTAALCRRVDSFGRYRPFDRDSFLAGRAQTVIVYTEVEGFAFAPVTAEADANTAPGPRWAVDLTQELQLFHDADGTLAWRSPPLGSRDISSRQRRDHYLVQRVDLPRSLTVGRYSLKVTVRDQTTGTTAERLVPIQVVADDALADR